MAKAAARGSGAAAFAYGGCLGPCLAGVGRPGQYQPFACQKAQASTGLP